MLPRRKVSKTGEQEPKREGNQRIHTCCENSQIECKQRSKHNNKHQPQRQRLYIMQRQDRNRRQARRQNHGDDLGHAVELLVRVDVCLARLERVARVGAVQHVAVDPGDADIAEEAGEAVALRGALGQGDQVGVVADVPAVFGDLEEEGAVVLALEPGSELGEVVPVRGREAVELAVLEEEVVFEGGV